MCTYSMVADQGRDDLRRWIEQSPPPAQHWPLLPPTPTPTPSLFDPRIADLERRVRALEDMLAAAKRYDEATGQPDCELESKKALLTDLAKQLGVEIHLP